MASRRCEGVTKNGPQCTRLASKNSDFCFYHGAPPKKKIAVKRHPKKRKVINRRPKERKVIPAPAPVVHAPVVDKFASCSSREDPITMDNLDDNHIKIVHTIEVSSLDPEVGVMQRHQTRNIDKALCMDKLSFVQTMNTQTKYYLRNRHGDITKERIYKDILNRHMVFTGSYMTSKNGIVLVPLSGRRDIARASDGYTQSVQLHAAIPMSKSIYKHLKDGTLTSDIVLEDTRVVRDLIQWTTGKKLESFVYESGQVDDRYGEYLTRRFSRYL